jgi:hypothetical protein
MNRRFHKRMLLLVLLLAGMILPGRAVDITAKIRGLVTDPKGALVPNVTVTATNIQTGVVYPTKSDSTGLYEFHQLPVGTYNITAQSPGFESFTATGISLTINQVYDEPVKLQVGSETQTVTVEAGAVQVDTSNMQLNNVVESQQMLDLPLIGRNFTQLEQTLPGVQASSDRFGTYSANGAQTQQSSFLINGTDSNDLPLNTLQVTPSLDALQEFNLITSSLNPEYSRNSGAIVSATIKNGTNHFHGDVFEFYRDTFLNNKNYFQATAPPYHQNMFGGTLGGPIFRDKLFFFASYQGTRAREPQANPIGTNVVFSAAQRAGDWSGTTFSTNPIPGTIHIPGCAGLTFAACFGKTGGVVPAAAFNPIAMSLVSKYVPLPNSSANRYLFNPVTTLVQDQGIARFDFTPTSKDSFWGVLLFQHNPSSDVLPFTGATLPGFGDVNTRETHQFAADYTHVFGPTLVNDFELHYTRFNYGAVEPQQVMLPSSVGFAITPQNPTVAGLPTINVNGYFDLGFSNNGPQPRIDQNYQADENISKTLGRHALKFGWDGRKFMVDNPFFNQNNGTFTYNNSNTDGSGDAGLDFLLGIPQSYGQGAGGLVDAYAFEQYFYGQDVWKATDALTVTYGIGYQIDTPLHNLQYGGEGVTCFIGGQQSHVFPTAPLGLNYPTDPGCNNASGATTPWMDFGPRFGFAWSPDLGPFSGGGSHKLSVRGGYGIYYNRTEEETSLQNLGDPPFGLSSSGAIDYPGTTGPSFANPYQDIQTGALFPNKFPATFAKPGQPVNFSLYEPLALSQYNPGFRVPYAQNFQVSIERELPSNIVARVSYVGSLGRHEQIVREGNPITPAGHAACLADPTCIAHRTIQNLDYPTHSLYGDSNVIASVGLITTEGTSNYNALQISATKGPTHGLAFQASYTFAHSLDDGSNFENAGFGGARGYNQFDPTLNYGNSAFDARNRFVFSPVYEAPGFGPSFLSPITKGWQISGIVTLAQGFPYDISYGGGNSNSLWCSSNFTFYACPDIPEQVAPLKRMNPRNNVQGNAWFDGTSFIDEPIGGFGNIGRDKYHGPGINNTDVVLAKNVYLGGNEARYIQLRLESYNVFNHTQFNLPDGNFNDSTFGQILGANPGRQNQIAAKFYF